MSQNYKLHGGSYSISTFQDHFGSWDNAIRKAGFTSGKIHAYSNDELFDEMQRVWEQLGQQPTFDQMQTNGKISPATYHNKFGSWIKAVHAFCDDRNNNQQIPAPRPQPTNLPRLLVENKPDRKRQVNTRPCVVTLPPNTKQSPNTPDRSIVLRKTGRQVPPRLRWRVFQRDNFKCQDCGRSPKEHGITLEVDHILAYTNGGETVFENLQTLCGDCNKGKSNLRR